MTDQTPTYRAAPVTQRDGSSLANSNCRMAAIATGIDYHTRGATRSTGKAMRSHQGDQSGGTDSGDAKRAWDDGYGQTLSVGDGGSWSEALERLRAGRLVHLDVWHATVDGAGICHSGSGAYGHTIAVAPDLEGSSWLVADPWCSPAKWGRVAEAELRAGAEEWGSRVFREATAGGGTLAAAARRLMSRSYPGHERAIDRGDTGGGGPIMYTYTKALELKGGDDMGILWRPQVWADPGVELFLDSACTNKITTTTAGGLITTLGAIATEDADGADYSALAVLVTTGQLRDDGANARAILWAKRADLPDAAEAEVKAWADSLWSLAHDDDGRYPCPPAGGDTAERDAEWIDALITGSAWPARP